MAGLGSRFKQAGYELPKPFIDVLGKPMITHVLDNLKVPDCNFILIHQEAHRPYFELCGRDFLDKYKATLVSIEGLTQGSACTVLAAHRLIHNSTPIVIANSDQYIDGGITDFVKDATTRNLDGSILTFIDEHKDPKWSFVEVDSNQMVTRAVEKVVISDRATVGVYYFKQGRYFVESALDMIVKQDMSRSEYYTCPTYNYTYRAGLKTGYFDISFQAMHGLGTPEDLNLYLQKRKS